MLTLPAIALATALASALATLLFLGLVSAPVVKHDQG
jgi:hypothetical protein